jgi:hypothetical protein
MTGLRPEALDEIKRAQIGTRSSADGVQLLLTEAPALFIVIFKGLALRKNDARLADLARF